MSDKCIEDYASKPVLIRLIKGQRAKLKTLEAENIELLRYKESYFKCENLEKSIDILTKQIKEAQNES